MASASRRQGGALARTQSSKWCCSVVGNVLRDGQWSDRDGGRAYASSGAEEAASVRSPSAQPSTPGMAVRSSPSVNRGEAAKFAKLSASWWDPNGPFKPLHAMNKARCEFIKKIIDDYIAENGAASARTRKRQVLNVLDVGCGGGILSESLATMHFRESNVQVSVLGIDVNQEGIDTAQEHKLAVHPELTASKLDYRTLAIEELLTENRSGPDLFDITIASEVIEHVDHPQEFCRNLIRATAPGGRIIISTLNRTVKSYGLAIIGAETVLRMVPEGTHDWSKFVTPEELVLMMTGDGTVGGRQGASLDTMAGMVLNPLSGMWRLDADSVDVNYISSFRIGGAEHT